MDQLALGIIGNCSVSALVDQQGRIVWSCMPRFDGDPVFCALLGSDASDALTGRGAFTIDLQHQSRTEQQYLRNTAVLVTEAVSWKSQISRLASGSSAACSIPQRLSSASGRWRAAR
ncbi:MAG: trehalase-like domain-containing protein [Chromatiales bacterium]